MSRQKRVALRVLIVLVAAGIAPDRATGQLSGVSHSATGSTCSGSNTADGFCGNVVSFPVANDGTTFTSRKAWNVNADVGAFSTRDISGTSVHDVTFTATSAGSYRVTIDTSRSGDVNRISDAAGCQGQASVDGVSASTNIALTTGGLTLEDPSDLGNGGTTSSIPFSQSNSATIERLSNGVPQLHSLSFSWSGSVRSNSCEAAVRIGLQNGSTTGCSACGYPGSPSRTESADGHFVVVTITHLCGDGIVNGVGEQCDQGGLNGTASSCCDTNCTLKSNGTACTDDGNVCTDDQCDGVSPLCQHPNNTAPCSDGVFCNGTDTCSGGSCSINSGDPCSGPDGDGNCSETCDELADLCDAPDPNGSACDNGLFCDGTETCSAGACTNSTGDPCPGPDGDLNCAESCAEGADNCLGNDPDGTTCRPEVGECDLEEQCVGGSCPADTFEPVSTPCGDPTDTACDNPDTCDGSNSCLNNLEPGGTVCRAATSGALCDEVETCDGISLFCPPDGVKPNGTVCRPDAGDCDVEETCDGSSNQCPGDGFEPAGTSCGSGSDTDCDDPDTCNGSGTCLVNNEADASSCDDGNLCTAGDQCTAGVCQGPIDLCANLDHYKCYQGKDLKNPKFTQQMVQTDDQLVNSEDVEVKKLAFVCSPVDTNGEGIDAPNAHLACYQLKAPKFGVRPQVELSTQFQTSRFEVKKGKLLCLPATKTLLP